MRQRVVLSLMILLAIGLRAQAELRAGYVGDSACQSCHAAEFDSFHKTAHFLTSSLPDEGSILGNFSSGNNILKTANPNLLFQMNAKEGAFTQSAVVATGSRSERFALVIGSGDKGQTYLFRDDDLLFQLPVSYWKDLGWVNSPGYRDGFADFERPVIPRCLECHATFFEAAPPPINRYSNTGFALGIQCEKCHGPGREHVAREQIKTTTPTDKAILNPERFSRDLQMDLCAWCHAGHGQSVTPAFSYRPGEPLERYLHFPPLQPNTPLDVHGNQVELLKRSRCFQASAMTCLTCHNVHVTQHDAGEFSAKCLTCHQPDSPTFAKANHRLVKNCIDCHMPKQATDLIVFDFQGKRVRPEVRNHWIKVY